MTQDEVNFLTEYHHFTAHHGTTVARLLVSRMRVLRSKLNGVCTPNENMAFGDELGHLLAHLHVLTYMQAEATCALLYGLFRRSDGIVPSLLSFHMGRHGDFLDAIDNREITPEKLGLQFAPPEERSEMHDQADSYLASRLRDLPGRLRKLDIKNSYNKLKHCGIVVRHPALLSSEDRVGEIDADTVYVPTSDSTADAFAPYPLPLHVKPGETPLEEAYLHEISFFGKLSAQLVRFFSPDADTPTTTDSP